jgi:hypothetical protein
MTTSTTAKTVTAKIASMPKTYAVSKARITARRA